MKKGEKDMKDFIITPKNYEKTGIDINQKAVIIPSSFKCKRTQYRVRSIGARCFKEKKDRKSVV